MPGTQHKSLRRYLVDLLAAAEGALRDGKTATARFLLCLYRAGYAQAPASTRRRWKCGR